MSEDDVRIIENDPRPRPRLPVWIPIVGIVGAIVLVWGYASRDPTTATTTAPNTIDTSVTLDITPTTSATPMSATTEPRPATEVSVTLLEGAPALEGDVAIATEPDSSDGGSLWVLGARGSFVRMDGVPFWPIWPGDYEYPMLMTDGNVVFTNLIDGFVVNATQVSTLKPLAEASFVVSGANAGHVWFIGDGIEWVALVDVEARTVGERFDVTGVFWYPVAGFADGLIVNPVDEDTYGRHAYWSPTGGLQPLDFSYSSQAGVHAVAGNLAVVVLPGVVRIQNITTGETLTTFDLDIGDGNVSSVCLSPDQQHFAIVGSTGDGFVGDTGDGSVVDLPPGVHGTDSIGWTSNTQLVYLIDLNEETLLHTLDIATGETRTIARLRSSNPWILAASGSMC